MKIFISWSGEKSKAVALVLRKWIPDVLQSVRPWVSEVDIDAGARWSGEIAKELSETSFGILCLTKSNQNAAWILFESGALAKTLSETFVCPFLVDLSPAELAAGPLAQFQAKRANESDTWELMCAVNKSLKDKSLSEESLRRAFDRWWPDLNKALGELPSEAGPSTVTRSLDDKTDEILNLVRSLSRNKSVEESEANEQTGLGLALRNLRNLSAALHSQAGNSEDIIDLSRALKIEVDLGLASEAGRFVAIEIRPRETLFETLTTIWGEMQDAVNAPEAYTYLWDWVIVRESDQMPLIAVGGMTTVISSHAIFQAGEVWVVHHLKDPLIRRIDQFGLVRGEPYRRGRMRRLDQESPI